MADEKIETIADAERAIMLQKSISSRPVYLGEVWNEALDKALEILQKLKAGLRERINDEVINVIDNAIKEWFESVYDRSEWVNAKYTIDGKLYVEWDWITNSFRLVVGAKLRKELRRVVGGDFSQGFLPKQKKLFGGEK